MSLKISCQNCPPLQTNAYLLHETTSNTLVIVDPATGADELFAQAQNLVAGGTRFAAIWNTHGHFDHVYDNARWKAEFGAPIYAHPADTFFLEHLREQSLWFGMPTPNVVSTDVELNEGDVLTLGDLSINVWHLPGHSPGSVAFGFSDFWIVGDVLFQGSVGRYDLPGSDARALARSVERLWTLPDETRILSGHGDDTTISEEKRHNAVALQLMRANL